MNNNTEMRSQGESNTMSPNTSRHNLRASSMTTSGHQAPRPRIQRRSRTDSSILDNTSMQSRKSTRSTIMESVKATPSQLREKCEQGIVGMAKKHFDLPGLAETPGWVFHVTSPPTCRSQESIADSMFKMLEWYREHPQPGQRPSFVTQPAVSLLDDVCADGPDCYDQFIPFPVLQPSVMKKGNHVIIEVPDQNVDTIFQRDLTLAMLEGESTTVRIETSYQSVTGTLIDFDLNDHAEVAKPEKVDEDQVLHPDLVSLNSTDINLTITSKETVRTHRRPRSVLNTQTPPHRRESKPPKLSPPKRTATAENDEPPPVSSHLVSKNHSAEASTLPKGTLPVTLRIAQIEALAKQKQEPAQRPNDKDRKKIQMPNLNKVLPATPIERHPRCLTPGSPLKTSKSPSIPSRGKLGSSRVAQTIRRIERREQLAEPTPTDYTPGKFSPRTSSLRDPPPEMPSTYQPYRRYRPYRPTVSQVPEIHVPEALRGNSAKPQFRQRLSKPGSDADTSISGPSHMGSVLKVETQTTQTSIYHEKDKLPYLAYSRTIVRRGTLHQLGGKVVSIPPRRKSNMSPENVASSHVFPRDSTDLKAKTPSPLASVHERRLKVNTNITQPMQPEPSAEITRSRSDEAVLAQNKQTVEEVRSTMRDKIGRATSRRLAEVTSGFAWPRFSDVDYEDPAVEYARHEKSKRRRTKWRGSHTVSHES